MDATTTNRGGATRLLRGEDQHALFAADVDQLEVFGGLSEHERQILAEAAELGELLPERTDGGARRPKSMFGLPGWYAETCDSLSRAVARGQLTALEANQELALWHGLLLAEMDRDKLWRWPKGGHRRRRKVVFRYRRWRCSQCGGPVGAFTGICASCHFRGWWR
jgi:hypothetical protein